MIELTKAEEQIMQVLWKLGPSFVKEIVQELPDPKPAVTTVSTIIRILEKKQVVAHKDFGNSYQYYPLISENEFSGFSLGKVIRSYFNDSYQNLVSHLIREKQLSLEEIDELLKLHKNKEL
ncbi:MAG: BlaI/MecI/CopY family transcriptional regulator [Bacteroidota bacterium]